MFGHLCLANYTVSIAQCIDVFAVSSICCCNVASDDGLRLLVDTLHLIQPSYVVQLRMDASRETKHLPNITPDFVANTPGLVYNQVLLLFYHCDFYLLSMCHLSFHSYSLSACLG